MARMIHQDRNLDGSDIPVQFQANKGEEFDPKRVVAAMRGVVQDEGLKGLAEGIMSSKEYGVRG